MALIEEFGTNIRSTVVNTLPNFVRGSVFIIVIIFKSLKDILGFINSILNNWIFLYNFSYDITYLYKRNIC